MGTDKLSLPWRGSTVLSATIERWTAVRDIHELLLVRRHQNQENQWTGVRVLVNADADEGMGRSLSVGARALPPDTDAVVVGLADMPDVSSATINALVAAWRPLGPQGIVAPVFDGRRGHPVVLGAFYIPALCCLGGDRGARSILQEYADNLTLVDVNDPGVLIDIDVPEDLRA
jgi:molybdenum cofactor cytidylyltransferase